MRNIILLLFIFLGSFNLLNAQEINHVQGELLVRFETSTNLKDVVADYNVRYNTSSINLDKCISKHMNIFTLVFDFSSIDENKLLSSLKRDQRIHTIQLNHLISDRAVPDDTLFSDQWQWMNPMDTDVDADLAWDITTGGVTANGDTIVVTVVDDGIRFDHPDFGDNLWYNHAEIPNDNIDNDNNGYVDDYRGWNINSDDDNVGSGSHGVSCAGMIGAQGNNNLGVTGINWNVKIMTVVRGGLTEANVIESYEYPLQSRILYNETNGAEGAFVVATNSSWGIDGGNPDDSPLWCSFYDTLGVNGIISCGATTNSSQDVDVVGDLPTACSSDYLVSVTATDINDNITFAGYGATTIDLGAPGDNIFTTSNTGYTNTSGTSFATPLTAGVIALMYSAPCSNIASLAMNDPSQAALNVIEYLYEGVDPQPSMQGLCVTGGRVNAFNSIQLLLEDCGPCPAPSALNTDNLLFTSTDIVWNNNDSTLTNDIRYRMIGAADWIEEIDVISPFSISNLDTCAQYEVQIKGNCLNENSEYTNSLNFTTEGCCESVSGLSILDITESSVNISFNAVLIAESYNIHLTNVETALTIIFSTSDLNNIVSLESCTNYEVQIETICPNENNPFTNTVNFFTPGCGSCTDNTYCESEANNSGEEWISSVSIGSYTNESIDNSGYTAYTNLNWDLQKGVPLPIELVPGFSGNTFSEYFKVWIDLNQDGEFDNNDEVVLSPGFTVNDTLFENIIIPVTALNGNTRMRIKMRFNGNDGNSPPCSVYAFGETEDYCINILDEPDVCDVVENVVLSSNTSNSVYMTWDENTVSISYLIEYKKMTESSWSSNTTSNNFINIDDLEGDVIYEFRITTVCPFAQSEISEVYTMLITDVNFIPNGTLNVYPSLVDAEVTIENNLNYTIEQVKIVSINGSLVLNNTIKSNNSLIQLDGLQDLSSGTYIILIETAEGITSQKFIKR